MRIASDILYRFMRAQGRGARPDVGDGELVIQPLTFPMFEIPGPVNRVFGGGAGSVVALEETVIKSENHAVAGVSAASNIDQIVFPQGLITLDLAAEFMFTGTTAVATSSSMALVDPDGNSATLCLFSHTTGRQASFFKRFTFSFSRTGFILRMSRGATIAGDTIAFSSFAVANRVI